MSVRVLVVDDETDVETLFRQQFRREVRQGRYTLDFALSGKAALEKIDGHEGEQIILLVSDINMPGMTGLELLPKVQAMRPEPPVIMITASSDAAMLHHATEAGADSVLGKPSDFAVLKGEIDQRPYARGLPA